MSFVTRTKRKEWETFDIVHIEDNQYGLRSVWGKYLTCESKDDSKFALSADAGKLLQSQTFTIISKGDDQYVLQCQLGTYLSAQPKGALECNRTAALSWEHFRIRNV